MHAQTAKRILNRIKESKNILLIPHQNPDGDTLGAVTAMMQYLTEQGKPHAAFCATPLSLSLSFLSHTSAITTNPQIWKSQEFDTIIVFDSGDLRYAGVADYIASLPKRPFIINIDHHATNELYGDINFVITSAPSTTEILYRFFYFNNLPISKNIATSLLTGLITDTGNFTNSATTTSSLTIAGELMKKGGDMNGITTAVLKDQTIDGLRLWGTVLARAERHPELDIVYTYVTQGDLTRCNASEKEVEGISNFLNTLNEGRAAMLLKELPNGDYKGSFRTTRNDVDVSAFAKLFHGGGHKKAAGFTVSGPIHTALEHVFRALHTATETP